MRSVLEKLLRREHLSRDEAEALMGAIVSGDVSEIQIAGVLIALRAKGETVAQVLASLGSEKVYVVHGSDGSDEVTVAGETRVTVLDGGRVETFEFTPESVGIERAHVRTLTGGTPEDNAKTIVAILDGARGSKRDAVVLNAGFVIAVAGLVESISDGVALAAAAIDDGRAKDVLERLRAATLEAAAP